MKKLILPIGPLFGILMATVILSLVLGIIHKETEGPGPEVLTNGTCMVLDTVVTSDNKVVLELNCQGIGAITNDPDVLVSWIKNPGPLTCTIYESGKVECQLSKQEAESPNL
ncbi:MAG: hypothetical protein G01um101413_252 [Parcubacteria group bacterium Gr01-1014_13]|nr:MAG: hypothetical protein G01um101413_252 [Parcubacteria group bacterium Gr01-1014_13]